jgi:hypothetical protein
MKSLEFSEYTIAMVSVMCWPLDGTLWMGDLPIAVLTPHPGIQWQVCPFFFLFVNCLCFRYQTKHLVCSLRFFLFFLSKLLYAPIYCDRIMRRII